MDLHPISPLSSAHPFALYESRAEVQCQVLDVLLTEDQGTHPIGLTQSPFFLHGWSGLYAALKHGRIDRQRIQRTLAEFLPAHQWANGWIVTALDVTPIPRPCSPTAEDRTLVHVANLPKGAKPVLPGWQMSLLVGLPPTPSSLIYPLEATRIPSTHDLRNECGTREQVLILTGENEHLFVSS